MGDRASAGSRGAHVGLGGSYETKLTACNATSGVKDYALKLNGMRRYSREWFSNVSVKRLAGSAKNSPLAMRNTLSTVNFVVGYNFRSCSESANGGFMPIPS